MIFCLIARLMYSSLAVKLPVPETTTDTIQQWRALLNCPPVCCSRLSPRKDAIRTSFRNLATESVLHKCSVTSGVNWMYVRAGEDEGLKKGKKLLGSLLTWLMQIFSFVKAFFNREYCCSNAEGCAQRFSLIWAVLVITILLVSCYCQVQYQTLVGIFLHCRPCQ